MADLDLEAVVRETKRLYGRYAVEVVEAFGFCPYAERARVDERAAEVVVTETEPSDDLLLSHVRALGDEPRVEVAFLILPLSSVGRLELAHRVERLRHAHQGEPKGLVMTMEGFHPDAPPDLSTAGRLVPFFRRTPHPTIQLTRLESLQRVRRSGPSGTAFVDVTGPDLMALLSQPAGDSVSERIAENNLERVKELGLQPIEAALDDIFRDRDLTFERLVPGWKPPR